MAKPAKSLRLALAQVNPTVGDIDGNAHIVREWTAKARDAGADLVLFPECVIPGYPAEDLLLKRDFLDSNVRAVGELAGDVKGIVALVGFAESDGDRLYNSLAVLTDGGIRTVYRKLLLPNYGVFDERRYFEPGDTPCTTEVAGVSIAVTICEDVWEPDSPALAQAGNANLIVNASASPYHCGKGSEREAMVADRARAAGTPLALGNTVGGQDDLVFDGHSVVVDADGNTVARARQFAEELLVCELGPDGGGGAVAEIMGPEEEVYGALVIGLRDYVEKNGFERVVLGLSGGIDSALVAMIAADALGPERVTAVVMPSPHSSPDTQEDARRIAKDLGVEVVEIPIEEPMQAYAEALAERFDGTDPGIAEENLQARIRGNLMMALSNKFGWLVLTTGNKSEMSVGYATLYGDMAGGFAAIKDVPKTLVYRLVRWRNEREGRELVPSSVLERAPSAELRPDQRDEDSLPPYDLLDQILEAYVEEDASRDELIERGMPADVVDDVLRKVDQAEYKRRQAPPGIKITPKAFGRDRRLPITNRYRSARAETTPRR